MTADPYAAYRTDPELEKNGILLDYGTFRVRIARAGGANKKYQKVLTKRAEPYKRQIQTETISTDVAEGLYKQAFAESVVLGWEVAEKAADGTVTYKPGVADPETGDIVPASPAAYVKVFNALNDIYVDIREQASKTALFRQTLLEEDAGN